MPKEKQKRIYWDKDESESVVKEALRLFFEDRKVWLYFAKAQKVLPQERQRKIIGVSGVSKELIDLFCKERQEILTQGVPFEVPVEVLKEKEILVERSREDVLKGLLTKEILGVLAERIAPFIDGLPALVQGIKSSPTPIRSTSTDNDHGVPLVKPDTAYKAKVLMCGFLESQRRDITEKASGFKLELIWRKKDGKTHDASPSCNYCVVNIKVGHPESGKMKARFEKSHFRLASGITETLKALAHFNSLTGMGV
ncbi:MAG: hypothetical protein WC827_02935 [Candidatus Paceibacterota bacterium]|jgi:hypothetical protein